MIGFGPLVGDWVIMGSHEYEIDARHRDWLRSVLMSGRFLRVLEVGSYKGYSTAAFLDALDAGQVQDVHLCDPYPRLDLEWLIAKRTGVTLHRCLSTELLDRDTDWDLVFLDGDHSTATVLSELDRLSRMDTLCVAFHDSGSGGRYPDCEGPGHLKRHYTRLGWYVTEDTLCRPGERTERGMGFATPDRAVWETVLEGFRVHC